MSKACYIFFILLSLVFFVAADASEGYSERESSLGKIITGISRDEAMRKFGQPDSAGKDLWRYDREKQFYVYFGADPLLSLYLYPRFYEITPDAPIELRVFGFFPDLKIKDVSPRVNFLFSQPEAFIRLQHTVFAARKAGEYQVVAKYNDVLSNAAYITVKESRLQDKTKEKLLSIDILPYHPVLPLSAGLDFAAIGTFHDPTNNKYFIRDVSREVSWFSSQGQGQSPQNDRHISFNSLGRHKVFCRLGAVQSFPQEVEVRDTYFSPKRTLKHIMVLPEFIFSSSGKDIKLTALATYNDNSTRDISAEAAWNTSGKDVVMPQARGTFVVKSEGICEVSAESSKIKSIPVKIVTVGNSSTVPLEVEPLNSKQKEIDSALLINDMRRQAKDVLKNIFGEVNRLKSIKIMPDYLRISQGQTKEMTAQGKYADGSTRDLTKIGEWSCLNDKIATVVKGKVKGMLQGETQIVLSFQGIKSPPAPVTVEGPKLLSLIVSPREARISMEEQLNLKAEGIFSDSSRQEMTSRVNWETDNKRVVRLSSGGLALPLGFGSARIYAEYTLVKSLPVSLRVILTGQWLMRQILRVVFILLGALCVVFIVLYLMVEGEKRRLRAGLSGDPRRFMVDLYANARKVLSLFGFSQRDNLAPILLAIKIEEKWAVDNGAFLRFAIRYEEARYSRHILKAQDALAFLGDYNNLIKILCRRLGKLEFLRRYVATLIYRRPLFI